MRRAKFMRTLMPLVLLPALAGPSFAQEHPNVNPNTVREQLTQQAPGESLAPSAPQTEQPKPAKPAKPPAKAPTPSPKAKASAKAPAKGAPATAAAAPKSAKAAAAPKKSAPEKAEKPPVEKPAAQKVSVVRRDPFDSLLSKARQGDAPPGNLPPGKAGLVVGTLRIDGIVRGPNGMIAIVTNPQQRVYFLREGDKLYDGSVEKIVLDAVSFHEIGKDAFGRPLERVVTKRLYATPGEQQ